MRFNVLKQVPSSFSEPVGLANKGGNTLTCYNESESQSSEINDSPRLVELPTGTECENDADASEKTQLCACFRKCNNSKNKYLLICKYIDCVSFVIFFVAWLCMTVGYFITVIS